MDCSPGSSPIVSVLTGRPIGSPSHEPHDYGRMTATSVLTHFLCFSLFVVGLARLPEPTTIGQITVPATIIFEIEPGGGGGGGGGGEASPEPATLQTLAGEDLAEQAVATGTHQPLIVPEPEPEVLDAEDVEETGTQVEAPIAAAAPDAVDQKGALEGASSIPPSAGPGTGGGAGTGTGTGIGPGEGPGIGPGHGGGFGGGAYRLGSGIEPPQLLRSVEPAYTSEALQKKLEGDVVLEVVILADGTVGEVRVLRGLETGLDQNAIAAARQWRFVPGKLRGEPVAVVAEIVVEFRLL
jgi:protein TonB